MGNKWFRFSMTVFGVIVYILLGWTIVIPTILTKIILDSYFERRVKYSMVCDDNKFYPGLQEKEARFMSGKNKLYGAFFSHEGHKPYRALMIVSHGIGCSHKNYLQVIDYFTRKDYLVFAFDMTGCCQSEGKGMEGLPQSIKDIKNAIIFASSQEEAKGLKTFVFGHSWSGYGSACALNDKEVRQRVSALATIAGFNEFWGIMRDQGVKKSSSIVKLAKPFAYIAYLFSFGKYAWMTGVGGISKYKGPVFVAHSKDDKTVNYKLSIAKQMKKCKNKNAEVHIYEDRGHTIYRPIECEKNIDRAREGKEKLVNVDDNVFTYFMNDRYRFSPREDVFGLDEEFMNQIEEFFSKQEGVTC